MIKAARLNTAELESEVVRVSLPTPYGMFDVHAFDRSGGHVYIAMVMGDIGAGDGLLTRLHSECLTGDALGSLRCDCGVQLRLALRMIAAEGRGVLVYATGHEGRGIGLINKLRAYVAQDKGADTVDANVALGLPIDSRDYTECAEVLAELGIHSVRLVTNNPSKVGGLRQAGIRVDDVVPVPTAPHHRNLGYLDTKSDRMDHVRPTGTSVAIDTTVAPGPSVGSTIDVMPLLGEVRARQNRPFVVLKYAQTLDGRIATATGDSKWISGEAERAVSHGLRAACDAVLVGVGTLLSDDPALTVRMVAGASPMRVVLDSSLRSPRDAKMFSPESATTVFTTEQSDERRRRELRALGVRVEVVAGDGGRVSIPEVLATLHRTGTRSVLIEGGSAVITDVLSKGLVDRMIVSISPLLIGSGTEAVNDLGVDVVANGIRLDNRTVICVGDDIIVAGDVCGWRGPDRAATADTGA
jgi:GTP cyclohydrolase II